MPSVIALDAMESERAPKPEIEGAIQAARQYGLAVLLVGPENIVRAELERHRSVARLPIDVVHASECITMDDKVEAIRAKRDSSMRVGLRLVREGRAHGFVTAGNTGAAMATAKIVLGAVPGVDRPALAGVFPTAPGNPAMLLDVGANVDCTPQNLEQFAIMGDVYFRAMFGKPARVGLLSIGEEETKGNELTREAFQRLKQLPLNFVGNVEGRDLYNGEVDVIVADGFVGNVALKISEGVAQSGAHGTERITEGDYHSPGRGIALPQCLRRFQEASGSHGVWWRSPVGRERRLHHHARVVECECHEKCSPGCGRVRGKRHQPVY